MRLMEASVIKGVVKTFDDAKAWGWVSGPTGDCFFHRNTCAGPVPEVGTLVSYESQPQSYV